MRSAEEEREHNSRACDGSPERLQGGLPRGIKPAVESLLIRWPDGAVCASRAGGRQADGGFHADSHGQRTALPARDPGRFHSRAQTDMHAWMDTFTCTYAYMHTYLDT